VRYISSLNVIFFNLIVTVLVAIFAGTNILFGRYLSKNSASAPIGKFLVQILNLVWEVILIPGLNLLNGILRSLTMTDRPG